MAASDSNSHDLYRAYRAEVEGERLVRSTRTACLVVIILSSAFIALDAIAFPNDFAFYLKVRLGLNVVLGTMFLRTARSYPLPSALIGCLAIGGALIAVIERAGGLLGEYYPGLVLLFVGMPVFMPYTARQASLLVGVLLGTLAVLPFFGEAFDWHRYIIHLFFPAAAAIECVASCALLDRFRFVDFNRRRELEQAHEDLQQLDREKSRFTANVHHELRTPLTLLLAPIEEMISGSFGSLSGLQKQYLETMQQNGRRLLGLINNLLDLAKIEGNQLKICRARTDPAEIFRRVAQNAQPLARQKGVEIREESLGSGAEICVDRDGIEKIAVNLIGNALKFTESGGQISLSATRTAGGIQICVADTGIGVPESQLERIFDRFAQVDTSATRRHEGTGIGLSLARELVELHQGRIWAESDGPGLGTRMQVWLPEGEEDQAVAETTLLSDADQSKDPALGLEGGSGIVWKRYGSGCEVEEGGDCALETTVDQSSETPEILICEDNPDMRKLLSFVVGREFRVRTAENGRSALSQVRERYPDLVLTDVMMPEMSGTELCEALKNDPEMRTIPIVLITSKAEREMKISALELGADDYVTKPFHPRELMARINSLVRIASLRKAVDTRNALLEKTNAELEKALADLNEASVQLAKSERLAAVGELAAGVAHEINNPMNFSSNALKALRDCVGDLNRVVRCIQHIDWTRGGNEGASLEELARLKAEVDFNSLDSVLEELLEIAEEGIERAQRLVVDLRDLATPREARRPGVDVVRVLTTTAELARHSMGQAGIELELDVPDDLPMIEADPGALGQVFLNLLKNSAEALEGRGGRVCVSATQSRDWIRVEVRDDGPGIAGDLREKVFDPFFSTKGAGRGSGLGLSVSRRIVREHRGELEICSPEGGGTEISVILPLEGLDAAEA